MGKCLYMRKGEANAGVHRYKDNFEDNSWEMIIEACQNNEVPDAWVVGDKKGMLINGVTYEIAVIGKNHDSYSDGSGLAPLTFQMHECYETKYPMTSALAGTQPYWPTCQMRVTTLPAILALMPAEVQSGIREVSKKTSNATTANTLVTTSDKLFILSEMEVCGWHGQVNNAEGVQYDYYKAGNTRVKMLDGVASDWYLRTPYFVSDVGWDYFCHVSPSGAVLGWGRTGEKGVSFGFCF